MKWLERATVRMMARSRTGEISFWLGKSQGESGNLFAQVYGNLSLEWNLGEWQVLVEMTVSKHWIFMEFHHKNKCSRLKHHNASSFERPQFHFK